MSQRTEEEQADELIRVSDELLCFVELNSNDFELVKGLKIILDQAAFSSDLDVIGNVKEFQDHCYWMNELIKHIEKLNLVTKELKNLTILKNTK